MVQLFDYLKLVFSKDDKSWNSLSSTDKSRNFFMLNRFMSIKYPVQAGALSHYRINLESVSDYWHRTMSSLYTSSPNWIYAKTKKKNDDAKKLDLPSPEMIKWHCERNEMSRRDFDEHVKFFGESFLSELRSMEKILKSQGLLDSNR
jgi:hypothetical protein